MNEIARRMFPDKADLYDSGICTNCEQGINFMDFRDELSKKEFHLSGMCQKCQDLTFN